MARWPAGIQLGLGVPCPALEVSRQPAAILRRFGRTAIELSSGCMTSPITARSENRRAGDGSRNLTRAG